MRFKALKVGELAKRTGLTVRTLHHYDEIGLLRPSLHTESGHRLYTAGDIARLQQVLSLRQLGFSLEEIAGCLDRPGFSPMEVIRLHVARLRDQIALQRRLCERLEAVAAHLEAAGEVSADEFIRTIEEMTMIESYYTPEQLETLKARGEQLGRGPHPAVAGGLGRADRRGPRRDGEGDRPGRSRGPGPGEAMDGSGERVHRRRPGNHSVPGTPVEGARRHHRRAARQPIRSARRLRIHRPGDGVREGPALIGRREFGFTETRRRRTARLPGPERRERSFRTDQGKEPPGDRAALAVDQFQDRLRPGSGMSSARSAGGSPGLRDRPGEEWARDELTRICIKARIGHASIRVVVGGRERRSRSGGQVASDLARRSGELRVRNSYRAHKTTRSSNPVPTSPISARHRALKVVVAVAAVLVRPKKSTTSCSYLTA